MEFIADFISCIGIIMQTYLQFDIGNGINVIYIFVSCIVFGIIVSALVRNVLSGVDNYSRKIRNSEKR